MPITVSGTTITFNDSTTQTTAATSVPATSTSVGAIIAAFPNVAAPTGVLNAYSFTRYAVGTTIAGSSLAYDVYGLNSSYGATGGLVQQAPAATGYTISNPGAGPYSNYNIVSGSATASVSPKASGVAYGIITFYYTTGLTGTYRAIYGSSIVSIGYPAGKGPASTHGIWYSGLWQRTA